MHAYLTRITAVLLSLFSFFTGVLLLLLTWSSYFRKTLIEQLKENQFSNALISIALIAFALFLMTNLWMERRRKYICFCKELGNVQVQRKIVRTYIQNYLEKTFQKELINCEVFIKRRKLAVECYLPFVPEEAQEGIAQAINEELSKVLSSQIGYTKKFSLIISYAPKAPNAELS